MVQPPPIFAILTATAAGSTCETMSSKARSSACNRQVGVVALTRPPPSSSTPPGHLAVEEEEVHASWRDVSIESSKACIYGRFLATMAMSSSSGDVHH